MATRAATAWLLLILLALPAATHAQNPYSDAAFRAFISVSVNDTEVTAYVTYLNVSYFREVNESAVGEVGSRVNATRNASNLHQQGIFSNESFTAEVLPLNDTPVRFTFEGQNITNAGGDDTVCKAVRTDENGVAKCNVLHYKDIITGNVRSLEQYRSCGYVTITSASKTVQGATVPEATQTAVVCPAKNEAITSLGPAIYTIISDPNRLPFCFPAMLAAGMLIAAMYYSGRDPLSLFDITTPKLPRTQTFKAKMQTAPQMLRQVQRRYIMIKNQARRDAVRDIARAAKASGKDVAQARRRMNEFYKYVEDLMNKRKLTDKDEFDIRQRFANLMNEYKYTDRNGGYQKFDRSIKFGSGLLESYLQAHQAWKSMGEARGKTSKGNLWTRNVSTPLIEKLTKASIAFETSGTGRVLGKIPLVRKVVSAPTKVLDATTQLRGSRAAIKAIRGEMLGQMATMLGQTKVGRPVYKAFRGAHIGAGDKPTGFGKLYTWATGRSFKTFEDKHDLTKKKLVEYANAVDRIRQNTVDVHNRMFDELAAKLLYEMPIRANAAKGIAERLKLSDEERQKLGIMKMNGLESIFSSIREKLDKTADGKRISKDIHALLGMDADKLSKADFNSLLARLDASGLLAKDKEAARALVRQLEISARYETDLMKLLKKGGSQSDMLEELDRLAKRGAQETGRKMDRERVDAISFSIREFKKAEDELRANLMVYLEKNYYQTIEKDQLKSDMAEGKTYEDLKKKYGAEVLRGFLDREHSDTYKKIIEVHAASSGDALRKAIEDLKRAVAGSTGLSGADGNALDLLASAYGKKRVLTVADIDKITSRVEALKSVKDAEAKAFEKFDSKYNSMKTWVLQGGQNRLFGNYYQIIQKLNTRLSDIGGADISRLVNEGCTLGKNPLEIVIGKSIEETLREKALASGMSAADANKYVEDAMKLIRQSLMEEKGKNSLNGMDAMEQFFKPKSGGAAHSREFLEMLAVLDRPGQKKVTSEDVMNGAMVRVLDFAREWSGKNWAAIEILHGGGNAGRYMASFGNATSDLMNAPKVKAQMAYLGGEKAFYRQEMGYADYRGVDLEGKIFMTRGWEKLFGYVVSKDWSGTSRGEQVLHLQGAARNEYASLLERYRVLYNNLVNRESILYDAKFAAGKAGGLAKLDAAAYDEIMKRGYTWQDKKNGLELLLSVDRKSAPMLEYDKRYFGKNADGSDKSEIIRKAEFTPNGKADIRDYAPLVARTMGSNYSSREVGFVILEKRGDKWIYTDPFKVKEAREEYGKAEKQVTLRENIMKALVGMREGNYDPNSAPIRVISTKDFVTYAKDKNYQDFFGNTGRLDRAREGLRSLSYKPGMLAAEFIYGAYNDRLDRMQHWYAAQYQLRQTLERNARMIDDDKYMLAGKKRFKYDEEYVKRMDDIYQPETPHGKMAEETRQRLTEEMEKQARGEGSFADAAKTWWHGWRSQIASKVVKDIGDAETQYYNAKLELRALEKMYEAKDITKAEYGALRSEALARKDELRSDYKDAVKSYGSLNRDLIGWSGSHDNLYIPQRTMWNLGLAGRALDSRFVQGTFQDFYQITESSVMRDPRVAIGAGAPGIDWAWYVGYHTGQNVYERSRFWATNSMWEQQMQMGLNLTMTVHKWWNDRISFFARYTSGYPATVKSDMMYAPTYENRSAGDFLKALFVTMPFQSRTYSDYFRARWQDAISFSGAGAMLATYQSMGSAERFDTEGRGWLRRQIDKYGTSSDHYFSTPFRISSQQRYIDQVMQFEDYVNRKGDRINVQVEGEGEMNLVQARDRLKEAIAAMDTEAQQRYKEGISEAVGGIAKLNDKRGRYVRDVLAGSDIQEDGSRNRFLDMYSMFHSNVFTPTIPGMLQAAPIGNTEWHTFPQLARQVEEAEQGKTRLGAMKHYWEGSYDSERGMITFSDRFTTKQDAVAEAYRNDVPVLMHLMKMQSKEIGYSPLNTPSLSYMSPVVFGLGRKLYKTALHYMPESSLTSTVDVESHDWTGLVPMGSKIKKMGMRWSDPDAYRQKYGAPHTMDGDYRNLIYGARASALVDDGEKTSEFLKWAHDTSIYKNKIISAPGWRKGSKEWQKERDSAMGQ